jgi:hypothetical protein
MHSIKLYENSIFKNYKYQFDNIEVANNYALMNDNIKSIDVFYGLTTVHISLSVYKAATFFSDNIENFIDTLTKRSFNVKMKKRERKMIRVESLNFERYNKKTGISSLELDISYPTSYFYRCFLKKLHFEKFRYQTQKKYINTEKKDEYNIFVALLLYKRLQPYYNGKVSTTIKIIEEVPFYRFNI